MKSLERRKKRKQNWNQSKFGDLFYSSQLDGLSNGWTVGKLHSKFLPRTSGMWICGQVASTKSKLSTYPHSARVSTNHIINFVINNQG